MKKFKVGDVYSIPQGTEVKVLVGVTIVDGVIVGKSSDDMNQMHIVKCTDGYLPNETYEYDTFVAPLSQIAYK